LFLHFNFLFSYIAFAAWCGRLDAAKKDLPQSTLRAQRFIKQYFIELCDLCLFLHGVSRDDLCGYFIFSFAKKSQGISELVN